MTQYTENGYLVNLINLTPHAVNFVTADGRQVDVQPEGIIARLEQHDVLSRWIGRIPVYKTEYGEVQNLPDPQPDTIYIVSGMVLSQVPERDDVLSPGALIRNDAGQVIGAGGFKEERQFTSNPPKKKASYKELVVFKRYVQTS